MNHTFVKALRAGFVAAMMSLTGNNVFAQVTVNGNVYGGGNDADVMVNTEVNISDGTVVGNVYGGGNLGDVGNIDKTDISNYKWTDTDGNANSSTGTKNTGVCTVNITGSTVLIGPAGNASSDKDHGNVFGGGKGNENGSFYCEEGMVYSTNVVISAGTVKGTVFGGGEVGRVEDNTIVTIGVAGASGDTNSPVINGDVFGAGKGLKTYGYSALVRGNPVVTVQGKTLVGGSVYGGGEIASVGKHKVKTAQGVPSDAPADLPVGLPYTLADTNLGKCTVTIKDHATITNNVYGAGQGIDDYTYDENFKRMGMSGWESFADADAYHVFLQTLALATDTHVNIEGSANVNGSVFGGSESGFVQFDTNVTIKDGVIGTDVYGGGRGLTNNTIAGRVNGNINVNILGGAITRDVYGGAALAKSNAKSTTTTGENPTTTYPTTTVNLLGGIIGGEAYGGGLGDTNTAADVGNTKVNLNGIEKSYYDAADATMQALFNPLIDKTSGSNGYPVKRTTVKGVTINQVFGANNTNGTPLGSVTVHVYGTQNVDCADISTKVACPVQGENVTAREYLGTLLTAATKSTDETTTTWLTGMDATILDAAKATYGDNEATSDEINTAITNVKAQLNNVYDVLAVYGGGDNANYTPDANIAETSKTTSVIIEGCDYTSIKNVYGGGNAAAAPATDVLILGSKIIDQVFGGGNGEAGSKFAAHVGFYRTSSGKTEYTIGSGKTFVKLVAGNINNVYGGSNSNGDIRGGANTIMPSKDSYTAYNCCDNLVTQNVYGGGKNADMSSGTSIVLGCMPDDWIDEIYAGSQEADVSGDVSLTITSGKFERVFGGNKTSGMIKGSITVNIEETGACDNVPIIIGELYGGGYQAKYSIYGYNDDKSPRTKTDYDTWYGTLSDEDKAKPENQPYDNPKLNVRSFTSIGAIYGGGFEADMVADPTVNINVVKGIHYNNGTIHSTTVDGVNYLAAGTTQKYHLPYPAHKLGEIGAIGNVFGGGNLAVVDGNSTVNIGTESKAYFITEPTNYRTGTDPMTPVSSGDYAGLYEVTVEGANITGNVYGGGNQADVTGNTQVNICVKKNTNNVYENVAPGTAGVSIGGDVFGAGKGKDDDVKKALVHGNSFVKMGGGSVIGNIYGGGEMSSVGDFTYNTDDIITGCADNTGTATVNISGGTVGDSGEYAYDADNTLSHTNGGNVFAGGKGVLKKSDDSYLTNWIKFAKVKNTVLTVSGTNTRIMSNIYGGGEIGTVGYETGSGANKTLVGGASIEITGGTIGTEIKNESDVTQYTFGSVYGGGYGSTTESTTDTTDPNAPKLFAGRVYGNTGVTMSAGAVKASIYGGGEVASVSGSATVTVSGGSVGIPKVNGKQFGGATMGNVYGGGNGNKNIVRAGQIFGNTTVSISQANDNIPTYIYHNVYGGGAYGTVGDFEYSYTTEAPGFVGIAKVNGIDHLISGGTANVTITGGTIGVDGKENGMVFGSSRGDVGAPQSRDDYLAWVNIANVVIGTSGATKGPQIYGSLYGSGENGHTFNNANVTLHSGTIGVTTASEATNITEDETTYSGAAYPKRGNVYGGGCGTDKYYENPALETYDGNGQLYNPLAGIVQGNATVTITGGQVAHNVYGAGAMGSVGKVVSTTTESGTTTTFTGGQTTIIISGGTIGVSGTVGDGNVFGAARGSADAPENDLALVAGNTSVSITGGTMYGNVYGGGELGYVGKFASKTNSETGSKTYTWPANSGLCEVSVGGTATVKGHVFGAGKGSSDSYECEPAMVYSTSVNISNGTVGTIENNALKEGTGNVYGGGQLGRVENNTVVTIGAAGDTEGTNKPDIKGDVFGAGAGVATHGYSALVRGNSTVTVQGKAKVGGSVYGGGETASVGRFVVNPVTSLPTTPYSGGTCTVTVNGGAAISEDVFGACKGVEPADYRTATHWTNDNQEHRFEGENAEKEYLSFLKTLALTSNTIVTIDGTSTVSGSVYGGGQRGVTLGTVAVGMTGGTVNKDVYGGGALADTNTGNATDYGTDSESLTSTSTYTTTVNLTGGTVGGDVYGGGLGQLAKAAVAADPDNNIEAQAAVSAVEAMVYGDVTVNLNDNSGTCEIDGSLFGCNNANGSPKGNVEVNVYGTYGHVDKTTNDNKLNYLTATDNQVNNKTYDLLGVYGGGNLATYDPVSDKSTTVNIYNCNTNSIKEVYGGGNSADVSSCNVNVYGAYEIGYVYNGGNGWLEGVDGATSDAPANVNGDATTIIRGGTIYRTFGGSNTNGSIRGTATLNIADASATDECQQAYLGDVFSYGNRAAMTNPASVTMGCLKNKVGALYGGAMNADIGTADNPSNLVLNINGGSYAKVFGGNKSSGKINGSITVNVEETDSSCPIIIDELFGCGNEAPYSVYGYNDDNTCKTKDDLAEGESAPYADPEINIISCTEIGSIYGGGLGSPAKVYGNPTVNINMVKVGQQTAYGEIGNVYGGGSEADVVGNTTVNIATSTEGKGANITGSIYGGGYGASTTVTGDVAVNVGGETTDGTFVGDITIGGSVYGGSALGAVNATRGTGSALSYTDGATTAVTLKKGNVTRYVFGGGQGNGTTTAHVYGPSTVTLYGDVIAGGLYGGCDANGEMHNGTQLDLFGGTVGQESAPTADILFGGGLGQATKVDGDVTVNVGSKDYTGDTSVTIWGNVYGGGALGDVNTPKTTSDATVYTTLVNLYKGTVHGNVFGGGLGQAAVGAQSAVLYADVVEYNTDKGTSLTADEFAALTDEQKIKTPAIDAKDAIAAAVKGNATVKLNENDGTCEVTGSIFGCNNTMGSPEGHVLVHVFKTVKAGNEKDPTNKTTLDDRWSENATYDLNAVYGGGNRADYEPTSETDYAEVIIDGCDETSIKEVYGGGYGAAVPATQVKIMGAYLINEVFGGGYGAGNNNPGANVGYYTYTDEADKTAYTVGNGKSQVKLYGGMVHTTYGGSNTKGNIRSGSSAGKATDVAVTCSLQVKNIYGAGKNADQDGGTDLVIGCIPGLKNVYGGAKDANIRGGVNLVITGGDFVNVFGGNDTSGTIQGPIKVFIEEDCDAINIMNLYLGGNQAPYSVYGYYKDSNDKLQPRTSATDSNPVADGTTAPDATTGQYEDPQLFVTKFTSIGNVYGGGYGAGAVMYGNPTVNVNEVKKKLANGIGTIGNVYGGGDAASIEGSTTVNIATNDYALLKYIIVGETDVTGYYTRSGAGTTESPYVYTVVAAEEPATSVLAQANTDYYMPVLGANITGDVFGGGNRAAVTGNTKVNICAIEADDPATTDVVEYKKVIPGAAGVTIEGTPPPTGGFGRGVFGGGNQGNVNGDSYVYFGGGAVNQTIYGGGCVADVLGNTHVTMLDGYVFDGVCGGGLKGSVGTIDTKATDALIYHTGTEAHTGCIGKPNKYKNETGKCTVVITGGQVGPVEVATQGMTRRASETDPYNPVSEGWVWGASRGEVKDPTSDLDSDFKTYVNETDVTIGGTAFILEGVIGGGEFGHVRGNTLVKIQDQCQIGVGANSTEAKRYTLDQWNEAEAAVRAGSAERINAIAALMPACSHFPYGRNDGTEQAPNWVYDTYDPYADKYNTPYAGGSTSKASDGKTWIGCVFGGGSGYMPYEKTGETGYNWDPAAGLVEGNSEVRISGGHILTCVYGGNEVTSVLGQSKVVMTGGTIGVPRKKDELKTNPMIGNLYGAGKGDPRTQFNGLTNVGSAVVEISGGIIYGSVYGGSENGHVQGDATVTVKKNTDSNKPNPIIGTWGASYIDGNVFGGGMGTTTNIHAGLVKGNTNITISDGTILHNIYGGGAYGSVGTFDLSTDADKESYHVPYKDMPVNWTANTGKATISITGGTIGTTGQENGMVFGSSRGDVGAPGAIHDKLAWVYDALVTIGTAATPAQGTEGQEGYEPAAPASGPEIKGSVYGSGENGHTFNDAVVTVNYGTIGIADSSDPGYTVTSDGKSYSGAAYRYRGNVYGGGCGTDKYYTGTIPDGHTANDGQGNKYNPLAGIVYGTTTVNINGGQVVRNIYGAGAMGSVGNFEKDATTKAITFNSGGTTTIAISGGIIGVSGTVGDGNVFGAARGDKDFTDRDLALVKETGVTVSGTTTTTQIKGNVYGGGEVGNVQTNTRVDIQGGAIARNVFGGGKGVEDLFTCEQAMVGVNDEGACADPSSETHKNKGTSVTVSNGTVGTLNGGNLVEGTGNVYGGGEIGRVEWNTQVTIGATTPSGNTVAPDIYGSVFGAGKGLETHGYSALVRGNSTVIVQGNAKVRQNVYGGGEKSTVGRYWVKNIPTTYCEGEDIPTAPDVPNGMPYKQRSGGKCKVTVQGNASVEHDVFGAGKGVEPSFTEGTSERMVKTDAGGQLEPFVDDATTGKTAEELYLEFLQTLALVTNTYVTINGSAQIMGSVYGGSESGFVQTNTDVDILNGTVSGDVYGGGLGLASFAEAGKVKGNTDIAVRGGTVEGNVYGGGSLGSVGTYTVSDDMRTFTWKDTDGNDNTADNSNNKNTGICNVTVDGSSTVIKGHVFGAGKGKDDTFWCEKGIAYKTIVNVKNGTVNGNVYGGGEVGRVETDTEVKVGLAPGEGGGTSEPTINGSVFGGGAGVETLGYSALVRGNTTVTIDQNAHVTHSVYGGGQIASVGKYGLDAQKMPSILQGGGYCYVTVKGHAAIGDDVFGAGKGVTPHFDKDNTDHSKRSRRMTVYTNSTDFPDGANTWEYCETYPNDYPGTKFVWEYFQTPKSYSTYLETLALATHPEVTIDENSTVSGSVFGGGELGITKGSVIVNIQGGTIAEDVYGGGSLANTNTTNSVDLDGDGETETVDPTTTVNLIGGTIEGNAYGGGLGQLGTAVEGVHYTAEDPEVINGTKTIEDWKVEPVAASEGAGAIKAMAYGDVFVNLGSANADGTPVVGCPTTAFKIDTYNGMAVVKSGRIFGCNNLNGTPKGNVTVTVNRTVEGSQGRSQTVDKDHVGTYEVAAVYGGGNLADYVPDDGAVKVIINSCDVSVKEVYGGGNAAEVPATDVMVLGAYEIYQVFGGGNGKDNYTLDNGTTWITNPGANVNGNAITSLRGGFIHEGYGGSNQKGTIYGNISINKEAGGRCTLNVIDLYGAGKDADVEGDLIMVMGCSETRTENVYGCSMNANVKGNVELTITSGEYGKVFGGNNKKGAIFGHIVVNIEEIGCTPIIIDELYGCGNDASYSTYGYYQDGTIEGTEGKPNYVARTSMDDENTAVTFEGKPHTVPPYDDPVVNVISCTRIGKVFGGGLGSGATVYGNPIVNINMMPGKFADEGKLGQVGCGYTDADHNAVEGGVYGGGNEARVEGNTTVNIGNMIGEDVTIAIVDNYGNPVRDTDGNYTFTTAKPTGANVVGNVYGGGNLADVGRYHLETTNEGAKVDIIDVEGNTSVNIGAKYDATEGKYVTMPTGSSGVTIGGHVFGGGQGEALKPASNESVSGAFRCGKAMVTGETNVVIGNGTVGGSVYGGGQIGRVEKNTAVTIGLEGDNDSAPIIEGEVFGAGKGVHSHGYAALVRGNTNVIVQGNAKVKESVYGGGEIASVGRYNIADANYVIDHPKLEEGMPYSLANSGSGYCNVIVRDNAEIGPDNMQMTKAGGPDDTGYVFGAGKGILPYEGTNDTDNKPGRVKPDDTWQDYSGEDKETAYLRFIETQGLATQTDVTITGNAFVKGSVYGGSFNGHVQHDTHVTIAGDCQIGAGYDTSTEKSLPKYSGWPSDATNFTTSWAECAHWDYDPNNAAPYDLYAKYSQKVDGKVKYYYDADCTKTAEGGYYIAKDGHTYYGNVFGGGSGSIPYAPGKWHREAGSVGGNTQVDITGGHILTSVYGGNEQTDVGTYKDMNNTIYESGGKCTINMTGGTIGVPRTDEDMKKHPVTCYLFGAGKGDQRIFFNTWTNVMETEVNISGDARIYGSTFGGGEDGHVIGNAKTNIGGSVTIGTGAAAVTTGYTNVIIGTTGTSYVDGNVFGGGRGFSGDAQTAGTVGGDVEVNIKNGTILGSVYGGGRLASVGTLFTAPNDPNYGQFVEDNGTESHGHVTVNISGGTIGRDFVKDADGNLPAGVEHSGNVFGGSMGRLTLLDNTTINPLWPKMAQSKTSTVYISGDNTQIKRNVYGGGELGSVREDAAISITNGTINGSVYGGGYGSEDYNNPTTVKVYWNNAPAYYTYTPMQWAGCVGGNTTVSVAGGQVKQNVYGGGQMASVGIIDYSVKADDSGPFEYEGATYAYNSITKHADIDNPGTSSEKVYGFGLSWPYEFTYVPCKPNTTEVGGKTTVSVSGGRIEGYVYGAGKGKAFERYTEAFCANVRETKVNINYPETPSSTGGSTNCIVESVYGGGEDGHVYENSAVDITGGLIGVSVYGGGKGEGKYPGTLYHIVEDAQGNKTAGEEYATDLPSWTAGKVYGNSSVTMSGGHVLVNVYGGGNMGSVGKGNYASGIDDYYPAGYGETLRNEGLWTITDRFDPDAPITESNKPTTMADYFLSSGKCTVNIIGGTVGTSNTVYGTVGGIEQKTPTGMVFGGSRGRAAEDIGRLSPRYAFAPDFFLGYVNKTEVTIGNANGGPTIYSQVFGGGRDGHVRNSSHVIINNGIIGQAYDAYNSISDEAERESQRRNCGNVYASGSGMGSWDDGKHHGTSSGSVTRNATVDVNGGNIYGNVYGGGAMSSVGPPTIPPTAAVAGIDWSKCTVNINGGYIGIGSDYSTYGYGGCVFGASRGGDLTADEFSEGNLDNYATTLWNEVNITGGTIAGDVYGGGQAGRVKKDNTVNLTGGTVAHDVFGGGMGTSTIAANVGGNTTVTLNGTPTVQTVGESSVTSYLDDCVVNGSIFGANNVNGTPKGHVTVHVFKTANSAKDPNVLAANRTTYDVAAVYGGGKQADYVPDAADAQQSTEVIIEGCDLTSIKDVYGGGYGAATPGTNVLIKGTYIIDNVFGGGYGASTTEFTNPGANVGYLSDGETQLGPNDGGKAVVQLMAGTVNHVYGGSNTLGNIRGGSNVGSVTNDGSAGCCEQLIVQEIFGGGKQADMYGSAEIVLGCMPNDWIGAIYAGAESSDIDHDVSLTLTSGKFGRVFGGNRSSGRIGGYIEVNIEENGGCDTPIVIGELYGGGDEAPYSIYGYEKNESTGKWEAKGPGNSPSDYQSPRINVRGFTSIGNIYGGGYGSSATVAGNPMVNINEVMVTNSDGTAAGKAYDPDDPDETKPELIDGTTVKLYKHDANSIGVINNVFGGGNAAKVIGSTYVNIGTEAETPFASLPKIPVVDANGDPIYETDQNGDPVYEVVNGQRVQETNADGTPLYESDGVTPKWKRVQKKTPQTKPVVGADIRGNVYGGGNAAEVTGETNVVIGKKASE